MQFELSKEYLDNIREAIEAGQDSVLEKELSQLHPADIAEIFEEINLEEVQYLLKVLNEEQRSDVVAELDHERREKLLHSLTSTEIAKTIIDHMESDDAADLIAELPDTKKEEVIALIDDQEQASDILDLLSYGEDTAGGLMATELIKVNLTWKISEAMTEMRKQADEVSQVHTVYVVDDRNKLLGKLSLKSLLFATDQTPIKDIFTPDIHFVLASKKAEDVGEIMNKYDLVTIPVVNEEQQLLGRITIDDVVDVIKEEAEKDYQMASGISEKVEVSDSIWVMSRARLPWLLIGMLGGILGALVLHRFEAQIDVNPAMAFFIPLIMAMGGNAGVQSSAIVVQSLANNTLRSDKIRSKLSKEFMVASLNGIVCSTLLLSYNLIAGYTPLTFIVSIALFCVILFAGFFGTVIPLVLDKFNIDPAVATGPFITTLNDILGIFTYFFIGQMLYAHLF